MSAPAKELRCHCGSLIARIVEGKLELKCRRCQRVGLIDLASVGVAAETVEIKWSGEPGKTRSR